MNTAIKKILELYKKSYSGFCQEVWLLSLVLLINRAGPKYRGRYMGVYGITFSTAFIIAPIVGTAIYEQYSSQALWYTVGIVGLILPLGFKLLRKEFA